MTKERYLLSPRNKAIALYIATFLGFIVLTQLQGKSSYIGLFLLWLMVAVLGFAIKCPDCGASYFKSAEGPYGPTLKKECSFCGGSVG